MLQITLSHPYTAQTVAQLFLDNVFKLHGMPTIIVGDRDSLFLNTFWQELFKLQGITLAHSTAYHPQIDGQTEVVNRCLETYLRCMCCDQSQTWFKWLSLVEFWYNTNYHSTINHTPFEILYGYPTLLHIPYFVKDSNVAAVDKLLIDREAILQLLKYHLARAQSRMQQMANKHRTDREFHIGDLV